jgi:hypothetical protein
MSGSTIHMRDQSVHPLRRARALVVAISVALNGASLGVSGAAAADPTTHGPGSPAWTHHLELEYGQ